jgi:hypothetical protein
VETQAPSKRVTSGTWVVLVIATSFVVIGIGNLITQWDQVSSDAGFAVAACLGVLVPLAALGWGVHRARTTAGA